MDDLAPPPSITEQLRAIVIGAPIIVETDKPQTVFAIASRLQNDGLKFTCRRVTGGVKVWRIEK